MGTCDFITVKTDELILFISGHPDGSLSYQCDSGFISVSPKTTLRDRTGSKKAILKHISEDITQVNSKPYVFKDFYVLAFI